MMELNANSLEGKNISSQLKQRVRDVCSNNRLLSSKELNSLCKEGLTVLESKRVRECFQVWSDNESYTEHKESSCLHSEREMFSSSTITTITTTQIEPSVEERLVWNDAKLDWCINLEPDSNASFIEKNESNSDNSQEETASSCPVSKPFYSLASHDELLAHQKDINEAISYLNKCICNDSTTSNEVRERLMSRKNSLLDEAYETRAALNIPNSTNEPCIIQCVSKLSKGSALRTRNLANNKPFRRKVQFAEEVDRMEEEKEKNRAQNGYENVSKNVGKTKYKNVSSNMCAKCDGPLSNPVHTLCSICHSEQQVLLLLHFASLTSFTLLQVILLHFTSLAFTSFVTICHRFIQ